MSADDLHVLVVGAGIGGLCLANGLRGAGVSCTVFERDRSPADRLDRYRLHLDPAGSRALHACLPAQQWRRFLDTAGRPGGGFGFIDDQLRELLVVEDAVMYPEHDDPAERAYPMDRRTLREVLLSGLDDVVRFEQRFERYDVAHDGRVTAWFTDGTRATGDILVGADGSGSRVRRQLLPDAGKIDTNALGVGLKLPLTPQTRAWLPPRLLRGENVTTTRDPFFLFISVYERAAGAPEDQDDYLLCAFVGRRDIWPAGTAELSGTRLRQAVSSMITDWHPDLRRLIAECDPDSVGRYPFAASAPVASWPSGPVTVLGDAVHLMPPTGGVGANTALRDAHLLTRRLTAAARGLTSRHDAIAGYEAEMRDYGFAAVRASLQTLRQGLATNPLQLAGTRAFFHVCQVVGPLRRVSFRDNWAEHARPRPWEQAGPPSPAAHPSER